MLPPSYLTCGACNTEHFTATEVSRDRTVFAKLFRIPKPTIFWEGLNLWPLDLFWLPDRTQTQLMPFKIRLHVVENVFSITKSHLMDTVCHTCSKCNSRPWNHLYRAHTGQLSTPTKLLLGSWLWELWHLKISWIPQQCTILKNRLKEISDKSTPIVSCKKSSFCS